MTALTSEWELYFCFYERQVYVKAIYGLHQALQIILEPVGEADRHVPAAAS